MMLDKTEDLLGLPELRQRFKVGRSTIYRWMSHGGFPKPIKLSDSVNRWRESDINAWVKAREEGQTNAPRAA